ncbi:phage portal protein, partial [Paenibacillus larvae]
EGYEYGSFHFLEPSFLHNYTDSTNISPADKDEWRNLEYIITRNIPHNTKEEAETVSLLEGIISKEDQLKLLSSISNVKEAIERLKKEREESSSYPDEFGGGIDGEQGILGETADSTVEASGEERETNAGKVG